MNRLFAWVCLTLLAAAPLVHGQAAEDQYITIYGLIQEADGFSQAGKTREAMLRYVEAQTALNKFVSAFPGWNDAVVKYRLRDVNEKIDVLTKKSPQDAVTPTSAPAPAVKINPPAGGAPASTPTPAAESPALQDEVRRLTSMNALLEAKLREALSVQPAAVDPREMARVEERARQLQKENELLKVSLGELRKAPLPPADDAGKTALAEATRKLTEQTVMVSALQSERETLLRQVEELKARPASPPLTPTTPAIAAANPPAALTGLQVSNKLLQAELIMAENRIKELTRRAETAEAARAGASAQSTAPGEVEKQLVALQARLEALDAQRVPYSAEELALFKQSLPKTAPAEAPAEAKKKKQAPPPGTGPLIEQANRAIDAGRFEEAEQKFLEVLRQDENNVYSLANLAAVQLDRARLEEAEKNLKKALANDPEDSASLYLLGSLRLRQEKLDEAITALSLSAKLKPDNAQTQFLLGKAFVQKGQRVPAESALRKALQLRPQWGEAHYALAVIYATQEPPARELGRWHYQRAMSGGAPRNADLEKLFEKLSAQATP